MSNNVKNIKISYTKIWKVYENSYKNILIHYIAYITNKSSKCVKTNNVNPLYLILNLMNGYFKEINGHKYLTLVPTNESKEKIKK